MHVQEEKRGLDRRARAVPTSSLAWSCVNLISMAPSGNGADFAIVFSIVEDVAALLLSQEQSDCVVHDQCRQS